MTPAPGERLLRFVGDRVRFSSPGAARLCPPTRAPCSAPISARRERLRQDIIATHAGKNPMSVAFWRDVPLQREAAGEWAIELPLTDVGFYRAKAYVLETAGTPSLAGGRRRGRLRPSQRLSHGQYHLLRFPADVRAVQNARVKTIDEGLEKKLNKLDDRGYVVIPPSGTLRDLMRELPHIMDTLGCRILQLLPVGPTPTTFARFGRFGSPYACLDLTGIDPALVEFDNEDQRRRAILRVDAGGASARRTRVAGHGDQSHRLGFDRFMRIIRNGSCAMPTEHLSVRARGE